MGFLHTLEGALAALLTYGLITEHNALLRAVHTEASALALLSTRPNARKEAVAVAGEVIVSMIDFYLARPSPAPSSEELPCALPRALAWQIAGALRAAEAQY